MCVQVVSFSTSLAAARAGQQDGVQQPYHEDASDDDADDIQEGSEDAGEDATDDNPGSGYRALEFFFNHLVNIAGDLKDANKSYLSGVLHFSHSYLCVHLGVI